MEMVRVHYCGVNDALCVQRATPSYFRRPATPPGPPRVGAPRAPRDTPRPCQPCPRVAGTPRSRRRPATNRHATGFRRQAPAGRRSDLGSLGIACSRRAQLTGGEETRGGEVSRTMAPAAARLRSRSRRRLCALRPQLTGGG